MERQIETGERIAILETEVKTLITNITAMRLEQKEQHELLIKKMTEMDDRLATVEKWRWMLLGAAVVIGWILAHVKLENLF